MVSQQEAIRISASCNFFQGRGPNDASVTFKGIKVNARTSLTVDTDTSNASLFGLQEAGLSMNEISTLTVPGVFALSKPVLNPTIQLQNNFVKATCGVVHVSYDHAKDQQKDTNDMDSQKQAELMHIPISLRIVVNQIVVDSQGDPSLSLQCDLLCIQHETPSNGEP
jgi:hypothetical protein